MKKLFTKRTVFCGAVILAVIIVPFLYSYFYLGAFWDPYSKLEKLPVAVVNQDKGAMINGTGRNLGTEMCDRLKEDGTLKFVFTGQEEAQAGTEGTDYYAMITIPENFSEDIASAETENKETALITFSPNEKRNYLASQILNRAVLEIEEETRSGIDREIVQELADNIGEVPGKLSELQDGLGKLGDGSSKLLDGTDTLLDGTGDLFSGTKSLAEGTGTLYSGVNTLKAGAKALTDGSKDLAAGTSSYYEKFKEYKAGVTGIKEGASSLAAGTKDLQAGIGKVQAGIGGLAGSTDNIDQLVKGAEALADGSETLNKGLTGYTGGVDSLITTVNDTAAFLSQYVKANPALLKDPAFTAFLQKLSDPAVAQSLQTLDGAGLQLRTASAQLSQGAGQLSAGTDKLTALEEAFEALSAGIAQVSGGSKDLSKGAGTLAAGAASLSTATDRLYTGAGDIAAGAAALNSGAEALDGGIKDLSNGAADLNSGANVLKSGAAALNTGAGDLKDGAEELSEGIAAAKSGVDTSVGASKDQLQALDGIADFAAAPVSIEQESVTSIANYGTAFAPYFMSLSLWVGALILFVGIYLDTEGRFKLLSRDSRHRVIRSFSFLLIGFAQAIALALIVKQGLGLKVDNVPLFYASICLVSMVFISIVQFLMVHLKSVGKLLSIVLLILQLTSCGGTFPMETVPKLFNVLFPYMPMTYSVALFKQAITSTDKNEVIYNSAVLGAILVVFMVLTIALSAAKAKRASKTEVKMPVQFE